MNLEQWDPFDRLSQFRHHSKEMLDEILQAVSEANDSDEAIAFQPDVDLVETTGDFRFYLAIPGLVEDDLVIHVEADSLTIRGERHPPYDVGHRKTQMNEWRYGYFERRFNLPNRVEVTSIRAAYDAGVLTIVAQKLDFDDCRNGVGQ